MGQSILHQRAQIIGAVRSFFNQRGFLEVETPLLIPQNAPEEYIDPLEVPLSPKPALPWQLQTSPELCMKRLLARGYGDIYQISRCWRSGERGQRHLSEFTMLEWYRPHADYQVLMQDCQDLLRHVADQCTPDGFFSHKNKKIDPYAPWRFLGVSEAFSGLTHTDALDAAEKGAFDTLMAESIEPSFQESRVPVILYDYPAKMAALARLKSDDGRYAERFELYLAGLELANGFSELIDPVEQRERFEEARRHRIKRSVSPGSLPKRFLSELDMVPPAAGIALGVDRLVMLTVGADQIDQVVAFTPEQL